MVIARSLSRFCIRQMLVDWIDDMLGHPLFEAPKGETTNRAKVNWGSPQGRILLRFIWNLVVNEFLVELTRLIYPVVGYVLKDSIQRLLTFVEYWDRETGLSVNPKTKITVSTKNRTRSVTLKLGDRNQHSKVALKIPSSPRLLYQEMHSLPMSEEESRW